MYHLSSDLFSKSIADFTGEEKMNFKNEKPMIIIFHKDKESNIDEFIDIYDTYSHDNEKIEVFDIQVNEYPEIADSYNITAFPATMYIPTRGKPIISQGYISTNEAFKDVREAIVNK